ncbi:amyloid-beta A4 precursor protein-binding family B member 2-like [Carcharodon carcharias]|uniref:amyloid-beta A4 precursor protein-binding family B member 2-like n=1 Tax=Carcharodon carcharias TaxID=13397 RepID=UPI001B7F6D7E|nr:amyloid-beta A4 precursor protein-binding family B member 2-like [Carcharodon carcharias]
MGCLRMCLCGRVWSLLSAANPGADMRGPSPRDGAGGQRWSTGGKGQSDRGAMSSSVSNQPGLVNVTGCVTPTLTLNLRSSHNELLNADIKRSTPPKGRKVYASTDLQAAMGLADETANSKWLKDGRNQMRKAAEHERKDQNRNLTSKTGETESSANKEQTESGDKGQTVNQAAPQGKGFLSYYMGLELSLDTCGGNSDKGQPLVIQLDQGDFETSEPDSAARPSDVRPSSMVDGEQPVEDAAKTSLIDPVEAPSDHRKSSCLFFGMRNTAASDEDSSWTSLSQGSASWSSPDEIESHNAEEALQPIESAPTDPIWNRNSFETDADLPSGWMRVRDTSGTYYWHIPTGTTQWEPPPPACDQEQGSRKPSVMSQCTTPSEEQQEVQTTTEISDTSLKEFEGATLRYASLNLGGQEEEDNYKKILNIDDESKCFAVRSLGWVEMLEEDLAPGKSSIAVNNCIRQLSYHKNNLHDTAGNWGEGKDMLLLLEDDTLNLIDPLGQSLLHTQPIVSIRVWGVGRDNGRVPDAKGFDDLVNLVKNHLPAKAVSDDATVQI